MVEGCSARAGEAETDEDASGVAKNATESNSIGRTYGKPLAFITSPQPATSASNWRIQPSRFLLIATQSG